MAYLTSVKSSMPCQHWWPSKRKQRVGVSSFYCGATSRKTLSAGTSFSCLEGTRRGKDPEKSRQQCTFYSRRRKRRRELELYFTSPWGTARSIMWFNGRPFWSNGEGFKSFFSGLRRCKRRCASSDKSLSKKPAKHCRNPAKILFAWRSPRRWITSDILASTSTSSRSLGRSV